MMCDESSKPLSASDFHDYSWCIIEKYFKYNKGYQLVKHQIESFNDFLLTKLEQIIDGFNPIDIHHQFVPEFEKFKHILNIEIKDPVLSKPTIYEKDGSVKCMTPNDARQRNFTYSSGLTIDLHMTVKTLGADGNYTIETKQIKNISLGKIQIMVK
jgi:DNA-directed RNA polymerase II subunit RPB2